jgi:flagellar biosynthesis/type III secretory pathway protein FliH
VTAEIDRLGKAAQIQAYLDVIARANPEILQEALKMSDSTLTLERVFEEAGLTAKWEAKGAARGKAEGMAEGKAKGKAECQRPIRAYYKAFPKTPPAIKKNIAFFTGYHYIFCRLRSCH